MSGSKPMVIWPINNSAKPVQITSGKKMLIASMRSDPAIIQMEGSCKRTTKPSSETSEATEPPVVTIAHFLVGKRRKSDSLFYRWFMSIGALEPDTPYALNLSYQAKGGHSQNMNPINFKTPEASKTNPKAHNPSADSHSGKFFFGGLTLAWPGDPANPDDITAYKDNFYAYGDLDQSPLLDATLTDQNGSVIYPYFQTSDIDSLTWSAQFPSLPPGTYTLFAEDTANESIWQAGLTVNNS